jgi:hypothetical protein
MIKEKKINLSLISFQNNIPYQYDHLQRIKKNLFFKYNKKLQTIC